MPDSLTPVRGRRLYKYVHEHRFGEDSGIFWSSPAEMDRIASSEAPGVELARLLDIDYETDREDESLAWDAVPFDSIPDISPKPTVGAGDPLSFLRNIDWDLLAKQRESLRDAGFMDDASKEGLMALLDGIQDLGSDTFS